LSMRLALAPPEVFRYVAVHELCHLRWRGHGKRFWDLVARQLPDHAQARDWLRRHGAALHEAKLT
jgi:predicted metal-dependent hydrolase